MMVNNLWDNVVDFKLTFDKHPKIEFIGAHVKLNACYSTQRIDQMQELFTDNVEIIDKPAETILEFMIDAITQRANAT